MKIYKIKIKKNKMLPILFQKKFKNYLNKSKNKKLNKITKK